MYESYLLVTYGWIEGGREGFREEMNGWDVGMDGYSYCSWILYCSKTPSLPSSLDLRTYVRVTEPETVTLQV